MVGFSWLFFPSINQWWNGMEMLLSIPSAD
jgi:hypothetical protein